MSTGCTAPRRSGFLAALALCATLLTGFFASTSPRPAAARPAPAPTYTAVRIQHPSGWNVYPVSMSENGVVAGYVDTDRLDAGDFPIRNAFVWRNNTLTVIPTLGGPDCRAQAWAVNDAGDVVGQSEVEQNGAVHAFLYHSSTGELVDLNSLLGTEESVAYGISESGQVAGEMGPIYRGNAFIWSSTNGVTDLGPGYAAAINASGAVAGQVRLMDEEGFRNRAAIWQNGELTVIPGLGGDGYNHYAADLNDSGAVVGASMHTDGFMHAFRWSNGVLTDLGNFGGGTYAAAASINNQGRIVGIATSGAFVWDNGQLTSLTNVLSPASGMVPAAAVSINNAGKIACQAWTINSTWVGAVLTPTGGSTPPPTSVDLTAHWTPATKTVKGTGTKLKATVSSTLTLQNTGATTSGKFSLKYYVSTTPDLSGAITTIGTAKMNPLKAGASKVIRYKVTLKSPIAELISGTYVVVVVDDGNKVSETDETNNLKSVQVP
jgi:probable HAF family extracellular repeat protein